MDLFLNEYNPAEWDLVSHHSDGDYLSISDTSEDDLILDQDLYNLTPHLALPSQSDASVYSSEFESEEVNFLEIKMISSFVDINNLLTQRSHLQQKLLTLTLGQFHLYDCYVSQIEHLTQKIDTIQQPSVVNIHHYTPTDAEFLSISKQPIQSSSLKVTPPTSENIRGKAIIPNES